MTTKVDINTASYERAVFRWKQGHQVFHVILVCMNTLLDDAVKAVEYRKLIKLQSILGRLSALYDAATVSMKYTVSFPVECYEEFIRPSMMPPFLSPGFSGTQNKEHKIMIEGFKELHETLVNHLGPKSEWPATIIESWEELSKAQVRNRKNHGFVCREFVDDGVSLLKDFYKNKEHLK
ncbi:hypothetical protein [Bacillus pseudomycoides]|uniref:hypothetical protein n=1 Tax=Bacillus pseudomycoides TaxID=64104 RepID=UPI000BFDEE35|nr:hypothetical protein [Bacillus pseudomycoides]PHE95337.1 hypothetical protein COF78_12725 [Bacillus pseudomycoides]